MNEEKIKEAALYYINNPVNVEEAAEHFKISKRTFQLHMKKLKEISEETYKLYQTKKEYNISIGQKYGGYFGKKESPYSQEDINDLAMFMMKNDLNYRDLSNLTGISRSYLQDMLTTRLEENSDLKRDFESFIETHKVNKSGTAIQENLTSKFKK